MDEALEIYCESGRIARERGGVPMTISSSSVVSMVVGLRGTVQHWALVTCIVPLYDDVPWAPQTGGTVLAFIMRDAV
jgi:hypothetical protein